MRDLLRRRGLLVQQHTANLLAMQNLFALDCGRSLIANEVKRLTPEGSGPLANQALAQIRLRPAYRHLLSISGIGQVLRLTILLETGPIVRFAAAGHYASYCHCVGSQRLSNGKRKGRGNTKNGNKYLAWAYLEAANFAVRYNAAINRYYQRKRAKSNGVVAIKTVAHHLARAGYHILREGSEFDVARACA